jgi:hypothetical protein
MVIPFMFLNFTMRGVCYAARSPDHPAQYQTRKFIKKALRNKWMMLE